MKRIKKRERTTTFGLRHGSIPAFFALLFTILLANIQVASAQALPNVKVQLNVKQESLENIFRQIEDQTKFHFVYNNAVVNVQRKIDLHINGVLADALTLLESKTGTEYKLVGKNIIVTGKAKQPSVLIRGRVYDDKQNPLAGATVKVMELNETDITDSSGQFQLHVPVGEYTFQASHIAFNAQLTNKISVAENRSQPVNIIMNPEAGNLNEVVVVGFGRQKKVNLTGSVATIKLEDLKNRPFTNASQVLQGVSGAYINQAGGQPGRDAVSVLIRGQGTINTTTPLVLVDGIEYTLSALNPNDIESISVLKDAASASIYGNRAANGVILVTTKKGVGSMGKLEYNNFFGTQQTTYLPDLVTDPIEFMTLRNQAQRNAGKATVDYSDALIQEYKNGMDTNAYIYPNNNWLDIMFNNASIQDHNLRFSGGTDKSDYAISLGYQDQKGVLMGTGSKRYTFKVNLNFKVKEWLKLGADISGLYRTIHEPASGIGTLMEMTFKAQAFHPTYLENGQYANTWVVTPGHNVYRHPLVLAKEGYLNTNNLRTLANLHADVKLPFNITYSVKVGLNKFDGFAAQFVPQITYYNTKTLAASTVDFYTANRNRHVTNTDNEELNLTLYHTLNWETSIQRKHNINVLLGNSYEDFYSRNFNATKEGYLGNSLYELDAGATNPATGGNSAQNNLIGFFGRVNYNFKQKYLLEGNLRYDGSSRFAKSNRWGLFPSVSAGWRLEQEDFIKNINFISALKLRASYGSLGNQNIPNFRYVNLVNTGYEYSLGGNTNAGAAITAYNDPNITWETTTIGNIGVDAAFFKNRLSLTVEYYNKRTSDILRQVNLPTQVGALTGPIKNVGTVENRGWEFIVSHQNRLGEFSYDINASINFNKNKIIQLQGQDIYSGNYISREGHPIDAYYILEADGIFQNKEEIDKSPYQNNTTKPGYIKFKNQNTDNVIDQDDRIITKSANPDFTYGFNLGAAYKGFRISAFFQGVQGLYTYPQAIVATPFWFGTSLTKDWVNNSWTPDRPNAKLPILTTFEDTQTDIYQPSTFWLLDASYLRAKNIQLSYSLPSKWLRKIRAQQLTLFVNGQNLFTISKMKDFDPERDNRAGNYYSYPSIKTYTGGINVTF